MGKEQGNGLLQVVFERNSCLSGIEEGLLLKLFGSWLDSSSQLQPGYREKLWQRAVDVFHDISVHVVGKLPCGSYPSQEVQVW